MTSTAILRIPSLVWGLSVFRCVIHILPSSFKASLISRIRILKIIKIVVCQLKLYHYLNEENINYIQKKKWLLLQNKIKVLCIEIIKIISNIPFTNIIGLPSFFFSVGFSGWVFPILICTRTTKMIATIWIQIWCNNYYLSGRKRGVHVFDIN